MPARKPIGAATRNETSTIGCQSQIGCQLPHQRSTSTMPSPIAAKKSVIQAARIQPAPSRSRRAVPCWTGGAPCTSWSAEIAVTSSHPFLLDWIRYWTSASSCAFGRLANGGMTFFGKPGCDVRVRVGDRRADELLERLLRLLRPLRQLVEVGPDLPGRAGRGRACGTSRTAGS